MRFDDTFNLKIERKVTNYKIEKPLTINKYIEISPERAERERRFWEEVARNPELVVERLRMTSALCSGRNYQKLPQLTYERRTNVAGLDELYLERSQTIEDILQIGFVLGAVRYEDIYGKKALDLGTGDGTGARVLKAYGVKVVGLDVERIFLDRAIKDGNLRPKETVESKAMDYLASLPTSSYDIITGFRIMRQFFTEKKPELWGEQIQANEFNAFYDLCLHTLIPNGILILSYGWDVRPEVDKSKAEGVFVEGIKSFDSFALFGRKVVV